MDVVLVVVAVAAVADVELVALRMDGAEKILFRTLASVLLSSLSLLSLFAFLDDEFFFLSRRSRCSLSMYMICCVMSEC